MQKFLRWIAVAMALAVTQQNVARADASEGPAHCGAMAIWDYSAGMCQGVAMAGMPMTMVMVHGTLFGVGTVQTKPRGTNNFAAPNMLMADLGRSVGDRSFLNLEVMATFEKWTFPTRGYPLFTQIGEEDKRGMPYRDAQHPHSSPLMGLTLSDTLTLGDATYLKLSFAPRGQATDGPIAFMHRDSSSDNPDAPLGHHIGQDVGHISSTVLAASLKQNNFRLEVSGFHGAEPKPTQIDLPIGPIDSFGFRTIYEFSPTVQGMASFAQVSHSESHAADHQDSSRDLPVRRYSASLYNQTDLSGKWSLVNTAIIGAITRYDDTPELWSFAEEFALRTGQSRIFGRIEVLQRTANELAIPQALPLSSRPEWLTALTAGYAYPIAKLADAEVALGTSLTVDLLPASFRQAYGTVPVSGRFFVRMGGMKMWDL